MWDKDLRAYWWAKFDVSVYEATTYHEFLLDTAYLNIANAVPN